MCFVTVHLIDIPGQKNKLTKSRHSLKNFQPNANLCATRRDAQHGCSHCTACWESFRTMAESQLLCVFVSATNQPSNFKGLRNSSLFSGLGGNFWPKLDFFFNHKLEWNLQVTLFKWLGWQVWVWKDHGFVCYPWQTPDTWPSYL